MNLPNQLTLIRLVLAALFVLAMEWPFSGNHSVALGIFSLAILTDYLDGAIARHWNLTTNFGRLMDPLADKILNASAFILLLVDSALPAWVVIIIISRDFLITGLRLLAAGKGVILPAEKLGKHKTAWQMVTILFFLVLLALPEWAATPRWWAAAWVYGGGFFVMITTVLTIYSGLGYFWKNRHLLLEA